MSQPVRPGNRERGWNDPPEFLHTENASTSATQKRTLLTQRVSHSFDGKPGEKPKEQLSEPPKLSAPPTNLVAKTETESEPNEVPPVLNEVSIEDLERILTENINLLKNNGLAGRTCDDILKRIKVFVNSWPKLNDVVKQRMDNLVKALEKSELNTANDLHVRLMLDFPSEVSQWMVGVKKLIHELIELNNKKEEPKPDDQTETPSQ